MLISTLSQEVIDAATEAASVVSPSQPTVPVALADFLNKLPFYILNLLFFSYLIFLWVFMVSWVNRDAAGRGLSPSTRQWFLVLVLVFNFPGLLLYLLLRPSQTLEEKERLAMEEELLKLELNKLRREEIASDSELRIKD